MAFDDRPDDGEAEAGAAGRSGAGGVEADEAIGDAIPVGSLDLEVTRDAVLSATPDLDD